MGKGTDTTTDLTRGYYRRQYSGFVRGRRINQLSLSAEAWFWRIHSAADDFGNLDGETALVFAATVGRRKNVSLEDVTAYVGEMLSADLIREYEVDGDKYIHVMEFTERQPAGKNGRRVRRVPESPWDSPEPPSVDSGGFRVNPSEVSAYQKQEQKHSQEHDENPPTEGCGVPASADTPPSPDPVVMVFPCSPGVRNKSRSWELHESYITELRDAFKGIDVDHECKLALMKIQAKPGMQKTHDGMKTFLLNWMGRAQDWRGGRNGEDRRPASERTRDRLSMRLSK